MYFLSTLLAAFSIDFSTFPKPDRVLISFIKFIILFVPSFLSASVIRLSGPTIRIYGEKELQSRYMNDDGSPSCWWIDKRIQSLQNSFFEFDISKRTQNKILKKFGDLSPDIVDRFEKFLCKKRVGDILNLDDLLNEFVETEKKQSLFRNILKNILVGSFPLLLSISLGILFNQPIGLLHLIVWSITLISLPFSYFGFRMQIGEFLLKIKQ